MFRLVLVMPVATTLILVAATARSNPQEHWKGLEFLIGDWVAEGGGMPGDASSGSFSFTPELDGKILVRRNKAEYPASGGRPAIKHEDLMVFYRDNVNHRISADYFDNEGHVINYAVTVASDGKNITCVSDPNVPGPRFRLVYTARPDGTVRGSFDMAQPGNDFVPYTTWSAHRK